MREECPFDGNIQVHLIASLQPTSAYRIDLIQGLYVRSNEALLFKLQCGRLCRLENQIDAWSTTFAGITLVSSGILS